MHGHGRGAGLLVLLDVDLCGIKFRAPHAIDATSSPQLHLLDGVEVHEGLGNNSQDFHTDTGSRGPISKTGFTLSGDGPTAGSSDIPPLMTEHLSHAVAPVSLVNLPSYVRAGLLGA